MKKFDIEGTKKELMEKTAILEKLMAERTLLGPGKNSEDPVKRPSTTSGASNASSLNRRTSVFIINHYYLS